MSRAYTDYIRLYRISLPEDRKNMGGSAYSVTYKMSMPLALQAASLDAILRQVYPDGGRIEVLCLKSSRSLDGIIEYHVHFIPYNNGLEDNE